MHVQYTYMYMYDCKIPSSDLVWLLSYTCWIKEEEGEDEQCGKLHVPLPSLYTKYYRTK